MEHSLRISVFYLSVGSGHQVAAEALSEALLRASGRVGVRVTDPFRESIEILPSLLETLQAASAMLTPGLYDSLWRRGAAGNLYDWITDLGPLQDLLISELEDHPADVLVATHVLPCALALELKSYPALFKKVFAVVTDFGVHTYWPTEGVDAYFVAHEDIRQTLIFRGVAPHTIHVTGIPVRLGFEGYSPVDGQPAEGKLRVLMTAGGVRSSGYFGFRQYFIDLIEALDKAHLSNLQMTIVTGSQKRLEKELKRYISEVSFDLRVLGFVHEMHQLMAENDVLISKPGGLTVSEALASGICLVTMRPNPGQESANVDFLARHGLAVRGQTPQEVVSQLTRFANSPHLVSELREKAARAGFPKSATSIANQVVRAALSTGALRPAPSLPGAEPVAEP
jgi:processive 1,2-diacylglycerol beta-glucosyltransferase